MAVFWDVVPCSPGDGGSNHLWNVGEFLSHYTVQHPIKQASSNKFICLPVIVGAEYYRVFAAPRVAYYRRLVRRKRSHHLPRKVLPRGWYAMYVQFCLKFHVFITVGELVLCRSAKTLCETVRIHFNPFGWSAVTAVCPQRFQIWKNCCWGRELVTQVSN
jgi:hypothetical protein